MFLATQLFTGHHSCFATSDDQKLFCWGNNQLKQLGFTTKKKEVPLPTLSPINSTFININCGYNFTIGMTTNDQVFVWGDNQCGQLGQGHKNEILSPIELPPPSQHKWKKFRCGCYHSFGLTEDNTVYSWGRNNYGQLGLGDNEDRSTPVIMNRKFIDIICGDYHSFGITEENNILTWGYNRYGQLGIDSTTNQLLPHPFKLPVNTNYQIYCGAHSSYAVLDNGQLFSWGYNGSGQLGLGDTTHQRTPVEVSLPNDIKCIKLFCGGYHCFIKSNNNIYGWGYNHEGQLGLGHTNNVLSPVIICDINFDSIICGEEHSFGITKEGTVYAWGSNEGQYGNGTTEGSLIPTIINEWRMIPSIEWNPNTHKYFGNTTRESIKMILFMSLINQNTGNPYHPKSLFYLLPKDIIFIVCQFIASSIRNIPSNNLCYVMESTRTSKK